MKTKMKTMMSICMLTVLLYACTKETPVPTPVLDCMGIENGTAMIDDCGECQKAYIYNYITHDTELLDDTTDVTLVGTTMIVMPGDPGDRFWNASCTDCMGILNGGAVLDSIDCIDCNGVLDGTARLDSCGDCHLAYIYNFTTHEATFIDDTVGVSSTLDPMTEMIGMPDHPNSPYWNSGCTK